MFNRELRVQVVKTSPDTEPNKEPRIQMTPLFIQAMVERNIKNAAILVGIGYAGKKVLDTASEIALLAAKSKL